MARVVLLSARAADHVSSNPFVIPFLLGIYTAIGRRWASRRVAPGFYLGQTVNEFATYTRPTDDLPYLFSFMGSTKTALARLSHSRAFFSRHRLRL